MALGQLAVRPVRHVQPRDLNISFHLVRKYFHRVIDLIMNDWYYYASCA